MTDIYSYSPTLAFYNTTSLFCNCQGFYEIGRCCHQSMLFPTWQSALTNSVEETTDFNESDLPEWFYEDNDDDTLSDCSSVSIDLEKFNCDCSEFLLNDRCEHTILLEKKEKEFEEYEKEQRYQYFCEFIEILSQERKINKNKK